jgi:hypothetical protein
VEQVFSWRGYYCYEKESNEKHGIDAPSTVVQDAPSTVGVRVEDRKADPVEEISKKISKVKRK